MNLPQMSISAGIMIVIILVLHILTVNKLPKRTFLILWDIVLVRLLLPITIPQTWYVRFPLHGQTIPSRALAQWTPLENVTMDAGALLPYDSLSNSTAHPFSIITILWSIGCIGLALFFILSYVRCYREFAMALPVKQEFVTAWQKDHPLRRHYHIRQTDCISSPLTYGIFRPVILLPKNMNWEDTENLNYVLLHERTHILHMDALRKMIFIGAVCIHWYNPLVWLMYRKASGDMELFCDESVLKQLDGDYRAAYASALIRMEEQRSLPAVMCFGGAMTRQRIFAIMKTGKNSFSRFAISIILILGIMMCFAASAVAAGQNVIDSEVFHMQPETARSLSGTWKLDGAETEQHLQQYDSLLEMFGTGVGAYGAELTIQDNLAIQFWIGIGAVYNGTLQTDDSEIYSATLEDSQHLIANPQQITLYLTEEADTTWLVMEFMGEQLYWTYIDGA